MSEEVENTEIEGEAEEGKLEAVEETPKLTADEIKAGPGGWTNKETWIADGNNPDDWISAKAFNKNGDLIRSLVSLQGAHKKLSENVDRRLDNQRILLERTFEAEKASLTAQRKSAIEDADVEKANLIQNKIDTLVVPPPEPQPQTISDEDKQLLVDFDAQNPWIKQDSPKSIFATHRFNQNIERGLGVQASINAAMTDVNQQFPDVNPRRQEAAAVEGGRSKTTKRAEPQVMWNQLTREQIGIYNEVKGAWKNKEDFLQSVQDIKEKKI